jgi:hypothetical protein
MIDMFGDSIGNWTSTQLVKFIKEIFQRDPPDQIPRTSIDELIVSTKLRVADTIEFLKNPYYSKVASSGSVDPYFKNSWVNYGSPYNPAGYWLDPLGVVHLRGVLKTGTVGSAAFTLPPGVRPANTELFVCISNGAVGRVEVSASGDVTPLSPSSNVYVSLDGITYKING